MKLQIIILRSIAAVFLLIALACFYNATYGRERKMGELDLQVRAMQQRYADAHLTDDESGLYEARERLAILKDANADVFWGLFFGLAAIVSSGLSCSPLKMQPLRFQNQQNSYVEEISYPALGTFLLGPLYIGLCGAWHPALAYFILSILTGGFFWMALPFLAVPILRKHFLTNGWVELKESIEKEKQLISQVKTKRHTREELEAMIGVKR